MHAKISVCRVTAQSIITLSRTSNMLLVMVIKLTIQVKSHLLMKQSLQISEKKSPGLLT